MMMKFAILSALPAAAMAAGGFSYDPASDRAPAAWGGLTDIPNNECGGFMQSGIDVPPSACNVNQDYVFSAGSCTIDDLRFSMNDHVIRADYDTTSGCVPPRMQIPGRPFTYEALQFHLHTGSDHAVNGRYYGACMHLVHKNLNGDGFSVLGFLLDPTSPEDTQDFGDLLLDGWEALAKTTLGTCSSLGVGIGNGNSTIKGGGRRLSTKQEDASHRRLPRAFNPYELVPPGASMYTYEGSLTTPPCSEVVFWNLIDTPVSISVREFLRLTNLILDYVNPTTCLYDSVAAPSGFTGRPVQPINGRTITRICPRDVVDEFAYLMEQDVATPTAPSTSGASMTGAVSVMTALMMMVAAAVTL